VVNTGDTSYLPHLESEAIRIIRKAIGSFKKPVMLFSGGKDSMLMMHLAYLAFGELPCPILHVDTGHNFDEVLAYRDKMASKYGAELLVAKVQDYIDGGIIEDEKGEVPSRNRLQSVPLMDTISKMGFDCVFGGGRRDEEKARAKERIFSHRNKEGVWKPENQQPELWDLYNTSHFSGEHFRVFPISNFTELDVWNYIASEKIELPSLYFSHNREVTFRNEMLMAVTPQFPLLEGQEAKNERIRFRTVGDISCTGAVYSDAENIEQVIMEISNSRTSERGTRADDRVKPSAMEDRKKQGYF